MPESAFNFIDTVDLLRMILRNGRADRHDIWAFSAKSLLHFNQAKHSFSRLTDLKSAEENVQHVKNELAALAVHGPL